MAVLAVLEVVPHHQVLAQEDLDILGHILEIHTLVVVAEVIIIAVAQAELVARAAVAQEARGKD